MSIPATVISILVVTVVSPAASCCWPPSIRICAISSTAPPNVSPESFTFEASPCFPSSTFLIASEISARFFPRVLHDVRRLPALPVAPTTRIELSGRTRTVPLPRTVIEFAVFGE